MGHEMLFHDQLQLNVLHILFLNSVLKNGSVEKKYPKIHYLRSVYMYIYAKLTPFNTFINIMNILKLS